VGQELAGGAAKLVTVLVQNASSTTIVLSNFVLWGSGVWEPGGAPVLGQSFGPGMLTLLNGVPDAYSSFGGSVNFTPADGGQLTTTWNWSSGQTVAPSASSSSSSLTATCWTANPQTTNPTVNFQITAVTI
jgi:hypothetical protein